MFSFINHFGFVQFKNGYFIKTNHKITGGEFIIDLNSITTTDMDILNVLNIVCKFIWVLQGHYLI